jgi:hypothetical protein
MTSIHKKNRTQNEDQTARPCRYESLLMQHETPQYKSVGSGLHQAFERCHDYEPTDRLAYCSQALYLINILIHLVSMCNIFWYKVSHNILHILIVLLVFILNAAQRALRAVS